MITLHGTGGDATSLFEVANYIDPLATIIGFQGEVNENGMSRYFARYPQGGFDLESLKNATNDLYHSMEKLIMEHQYENHSITILGYSNGANLAKNLLKEFENLKVQHVILFHPSPITPNHQYKQQNNVRVLITSGTNDPYISESEFKEMKDKMMAANIDVVSLTHSYGHQLMQEELEESKTFLKRALKDVTKRED